MPSLNHSTELAETVLGTAEAPAEQFLGAQGEAESRSPTDRAQASDVLVQRVS